MTLRNAAVSAGLIAGLITARGCSEPGPYSVHFTGASIDARILQETEAVFVREGYSLHRKERKYGRELIFYLRFIDDNSRFLGANWVFVYSADSLMLSDFNMGAYLSHGELQPEIKAEIDRMVDLLHPILLERVVVDSLRMNGLKVTVYERDGKKMKVYERAP